MTIRPSSAHPWAAAHIGQCIALPTQAPAQGDRRGDDRGATWPRLVLGQHHPGSTAMLAAAAVGAQPDVSPPPADRGLDDSAAPTGRR